MNESMIEEFNNLGGGTIQEHKKNFCLYMNKLQSLSQPERQKILDCLQAAHRQEEIFLVKLFLKFQHIDQLKTIVLRGDRVLNRIITCHKPFIFRGENADYFLNDLFPNASYIVQQKCLHNLTKVIEDKNVGEEFFKRVLEKYGIKTAQILLPLCSESFVRKMILQYRIIFVDRQMIMLHQTFGLDFVDFYYGECTKYAWHHPFGDQVFFARHLSVKDIQSFGGLLKYGVPEIGKRGSRNFLRAYKAEILNDSNKYSFLKYKFVYRSLTKEEFKMYLLNKCPPNADNFNVNKFVGVLKPVNIKNRGNLLFSIFEEKYGYSLNVKNRFNRVSYRLKEILSAEDLLKFEMDDYQKLEYMPPSLSFPMIKERINLTSDCSDRRQLIEKMFVSAKNYSDEAALLEALTYFNKRHKNDQSLTRSDLYWKLRGMFTMEKLGSEIWKILHEWIEGEFLMAGENLLHLIHMFDDDLKYSFENGLECLPIFKKCLKSRSYEQFKFTTSNKDLRRWFIDHFLPVAAEVYSNDGEAVKFWPESFLCIIRDWNKDYPKEMISYYKYQDILNLALVHHQKNYYTIFVDILTYATIDPQEREIQDGLIEQHLPKFANHEKLWFWLLKNRIGVVEKHFELFFNDFISSQTNFLYEISKMHYNPLSEQFRNKCLQIVNESKKLIGQEDKEGTILSAQRRNALLFLSYQENFMEVINDEIYYPSGEAEVNIVDVLSRDLYNLREHVLRCLRNRSCSEEVIPMLIRFCFKDYFNHALPVLTVVLYNLPERALSGVLEILQDRSVSVRKKAIFFGSILGSAEGICKSLQSVGEHEKNKSLQKFVINRSFKSFCSLGSEESWELLNAHFKFVFEHDSETQNMLLQFNLIPRVYLPAYIEKVWNSMGKRWDDMNDKVLGAIRVDIIPLLPDELCEDIVQFRLGQSKDWVSSDVDFIYKYLLSGGEKIDHRLDLIAKNTRLEVSEGNIQELSLKAHNISFMYKDICVRFLLGDEGSLEDKKLLVDKLITRIHDLPLPYNRIDYQMQFEICRCYLNDRTLLPELIVRLLKDMINEHGDAMQGYFNDFVASQILIWGEVESRLDFLQKLLNVDNSREVKLLAIRLLPDDYPTSEVTAAKWLDVMDKIEKDAGPVVELFKKRYLKNVYVDYAISTTVFKVKRLRKF